VTSGKSLESRSSESGSRSSESHLNPKIETKSLAHNARTRVKALLSVGLLALLSGSSLSAQVLPPEAGQRVGRGVFEQNCASCHVSGSPDQRAPDRQTLMKLSPEAIYAALTTGPMSEQAKNLTDVQKRAIANFLSGRPFGSADAGDAAKMPNHCASSSSLTGQSAAPRWNGWGNDVLNTRFQTASAAGLTSDRVPQLKLKWAFGFPYGAEAYGQPTVAAGRVFLGTDTGFVYSLDANTGCIYWSFHVDSGVRTAISIGPLAGQGTGTSAAYFGDGKANVYAVNAETGELLWKTHVDEHSLARITGAPTLYKERLYVPVSSSEEGSSINAHYPCCTFRGSIVALDTKTGQQVWKTYAIADSPKPTEKNSSGTQLFGPAGAAIWNAPTIDAKRHLLYVGTGDGYTVPTASNSDSILAVDLKSGKILWSYQETKNDTWMAGCGPTNQIGNCPDDLGPDYDFSTSPILRSLPDGHRVLLVAGKAGIVSGLDPDRKGALLWKTVLAKKPADYHGLIVFGGAADEQTVYYGLNLVGGVAALDWATGKTKWIRSIQPETLPGDKSRPGQSAAVTAIPGVVFSGGWDGVLRALSTDDGQVLWQFNTIQDFKTVNGVQAKGGSMGAPGPTIAAGMLFVGSGYIGVNNGLPGNVLLAFSVQ
jgi:polyvinyl alcohol dehydrogenase (cytochrome)